MNAPRSLLSAGSLFAIVVIAALAIANEPARAGIGLSLQMQLGNASGAIVDPNNHQHYLVQRDQYALDYSDTLGGPNWVAWDLTSGDIGTTPRGNYTTDNTLPATFYHVKSSDYTNSGFDRGHMCPSDDRTDNVTDNNVVFLMSNFLPQTADNNQGVWESFEYYCRSLANAGDEVLQTDAGSGYTGSYIPSGKVAIPGYTWKIVVDVLAGGGTALSRITTSTRVIALKIPNIAGIRSDPWSKYVTSTNQIQADTGFVFFSAVPASVAAVLRARVDGAPAPSLTSFSPSAGAVGSAVTVTGSGFIGASSVAFNGTNGSFTVNSDTQITATVPTGSTTGKITVIAPGGLATSSTNFTVSASVAITVSQVYGGGGNSGATYKNDFIELYNAGATTVDLSTYAVQYASATSSSWSETLLSGSIAPGHHYLIQEAAGTGGTTNLPTPEATGTINFSATSGKIALTKTQTLLNVDNPVGSSAVADFVGFGTADAYEGAGAAPTLSNTTAALRGAAGATDTNNNAADFTAGAPTPRN
ncbi:MAG: DNA/RNA non-specific endonuclease [Chthoniobacterales bacterium]